MSQAALGEAIGGDTATIYRTEAGDNLPQLATFAAMCIALDVTSDFLLFGESGRPRVMVKR